MRARLVLVAACVLAQGCASLPEPAPPAVDVPAGWRTGAIGERSLADLP